MNIVLFTNLFPSTIEPERGNFIALMAKKLAQKTTLHVISPLPWFPKLGIIQHIPLLAGWRKFGQVPDQENHEGIIVNYPKYFFLPKIGSLFQPFSIAITSFNHVKKLHQNYNLDIINAHWIFPDAVAAVYISRKLGIPCVISARGCDINNFSNSILKRIQINWALKHANAITVVSDALKEKIIEIYNIKEQKINTILNGVDSSIFHLMNQKECQAILELNPAKKKLLFVGQLHPVKNLETMIRALSKIKLEGGLDFETLIIGMGPLEKELRDLASELQLTSTDIVFKGQQSHSSVAKYYGASDLLCLPSIREGRPNVIIEALATGLPVVASNVGGIPELINKQNGELVQPLDIEQLAAKLKFSLDKEWDRKKISCSQTTSSWDDCASKYHNLFLSLL